ncbi:MAG: glycerophosphodiester phosphodiesterase family protein [Chitinophagaceae bacterium]|nr:glycerophosphodiester phosphodiesterase family protein [Chitinophagaceae bacterium]
MKKIQNIVIGALLLMIAFNSAAQQSSNNLTFRNVDELQQFLSYSKKRFPLISAHRGGPEKGFPENAIETFEHSYQLQPLIIECDISLSRDSVMILMHDNSLNRTSTGSGRIGDFTYEELKKLYLKDNGGDSTEFRIPTLEEALIWGRGKVIFTLDVKRGVPYRKVIEMVRKCKAESSSVIITYNADQAAEVFQLAPDLLISASVRGKEDLDRLNGKGVPDKKIIAFIGVTEAQPETYELLHSRGISCILGTMGNLDRQATARGDNQYAEYISRGADILSTDRPKEAGEALKKYRADNKLVLPVRKKK